MISRSENYDSGTVFINFAQAETSIVNKHLPTRQAIYKSAEKLNTY